MDTEMAGLQTWVANTFGGPNGIRAQTLRHFVRNENLPVTANTITQELFRRANIPTGVGSLTRLAEARRNYIRGELQNITEAIRHRRALRNPMGPATGLRSRQRFLNVDRYEEDVQEIEDSFHSHRRDYPDAGNRRVITFRRRSAYDGEAEYFWEAASRNIHRIMQVFPEDTIIQVTVSSPSNSTYVRRISSSQHAGSGALHVADITANTLAAAAAKIFYSDVTAELSDITFTITFYPYGNPERLTRRVARNNRRGRGLNVRGRGNERKGKWINTRPIELRNIKGLTDVPPKGNRCGFKVLVLGMESWKAKQEGARFRLLEDGYATKLLDLAVALQKELGIPENIDSTETKDFATFVEKYPEWRVICVNAFRQDIGDSPWEGTDFVDPDPAVDPNDYGKTIFVFYDARSRHFCWIHPSAFSNFGHSGAHSGHYRVCRACLERMTAAAFKKHVCEVDGRGFCKVCNVLFSGEDLETHLAGATIVCPQCSIECHGNECYESHFAKCKGKDMACHKCKEAFENPEELKKHFCEVVKCPNRHCSKMFDIDQYEKHRCYMGVIGKRKKKSKKGAKKRKRSVVDDEVEETEAEEEELEEEEEAEEDTSGVDLLSHWAWDCESMATDDPDEEYTGKLQLVNFIVAVNLATKEELCFTNMEDFLGWACLGEEDNRTKKTLWSHNGAKYDTRLVYDYAVNNMAAALILPGSTIAQNKIFELKLANACFRDSYLQFPMALAELPKSFGINTERVTYKLGIAELKKGFFPYTFNTPENQNYIGRLPGLEYYEPWKRKERDVYSPSESDRDGVQLWHMSETERIDEAIARGEEGWNFQKELADYCKMDTYILAEALCTWREMNIEMGNVDPLTSLTLPGHAHKTFRTKYLTPDTIPVLRAHKRIAHSYGYPGLDEESLARMAYFGGNTNCRRMKLELSEDMLDAGHRIAMYDFKSQYPFVMVNHEYPIGDYKYEAFVTYDQPSLDFIHSVHGVMACEIYYPSNQAPLFHPILPSRHEGKLTFALRSKPELTKADMEHWENIRGEAGFPTCQCNICKRVKGRAFPTYTILEVRKALQHGYKIEHVHWMLHTTTTSATIFNGYIGANYRLKTMSAKAPKDEVDFSDPEAVEEYVRKHLDIGIDIAAELEQGQPVEEWHKPNPGLKQLGKLMMNSQYGKLGQGGYNTTTEFVSTQDEEEALWARDGVDIDIVGRSYYREVGVYKIKSKDISSNVGTTNVMLAAYVTAYGRLLLWDLCNQYGRDVIYHDTDSAIIHIRPDGPAPPPTGPYLGDLEEEIQAAHAFVSTGPKSYAIKYWGDAHPSHYEWIGYDATSLEAMDPSERDLLLLETGEGAFRWKDGKLQYEKIKQRNKGITLSSENAKVLNYDLMRAMVDAMCFNLDPIEAEVSSTNFIWKRDVSKFFVTEGKKKIGANKDILKGRIGGPDGYTLMPHGAEDYDWDWDNIWLDK